METQRHTTVVIEQTLYAGTTAEIDLPDGLAWEDIVDWYIKWDTLHYTTGSEWHEIELNSAVDDVIDWKRPQFATVYTPDYETELGSHG
jgi:hypothetical protein